MHQPKKMMRLMFFALASALLLGNASAQSRYLRWRGQKIYLSGVNVAWQSYGADFAVVEEWGNHNGYSHAATETMFANLNAAGCNCVRWWVFCDGRGGPEFDADNGGNVTGLDEATLAHMEDAIRLAADHDIYIVFCLWNFDLLFDDSTAGGRGDHAGGHRNLLTDTTALGSFITNAFLPILRHPVANTSHTIATHPNVLAWEIMNEPEWAITESDSVNSEISEPVSLAQMQRFVAVLSGIIHRHSNQLVTLGSASLKWNSDTALGAAGNWWTDSALLPHDPDGALDFYQVHYYGWMNGDETYWSYSPLFNSWAQAGLDKPTVIGEFPADGGATGWTVGEILDGCYSNHYAGSWSWTYTGVDAIGDWSDSAAAYESFGSNHIDQIRPPADLDSDHDGVPDISEYVAGTNPESASSFFRLTIRTTNEAQEVSFDTLAADGIGYGGVTRFYALEQSDTLTPSEWPVVAGYERIAGTNGSVPYRPPPSYTAPGFYRVRTWLENR